MRPGVIAAVIAIQLAGACTSPVAPAHVEPAKRATLWLGGDVFLGHGGTHALDAIPALVGRAPGIVNLEGAVGTANGPPDPTHPVLIHDRAALAELRDIGVIVAGIANNHAGDAGPRPTTARELTAIGIRPSGGPAGPAVVELDGLRVVVTAHDLEHGVPAQLEHELVAARRQGDLLIATFHVTGPASYLPTTELTEAVTIAARAGAQVIAAHGSHELARVERRGHTVIAWGLGNLAFACACTDEDSGAIAVLELSHDGVGAATIIPIDAGLVGKPTRASSEPDVTFELLESLGSHLERHGDRASF